MATQIHIAGSTWIRVSRQLANRSFTASYSMTKAPTTRASGASHHRERLSLRIPSSTADSSPSRIAPISRSARARQTTADLRGFLRNDVDAQRDHADRDELEVAQGERDANDRQAEQDPGDQVADGQPPAEQDDPDDVADQRAQPGGRAHVDGPAERPQRIPGDPEGGDAERDGDDQHEAHQPGRRVEDG